MFRSPNLSHRYQHVSNGSHGFRIRRDPHGIRGLILPSKEGTHQHEEAVGLVIAALPGRFSAGKSEKGHYMAVGQNLVPLVNIKIAGKWMFIPLKMVLIGIDPYPYM